MRVDPFVAVVRSADNGARHLVMTGEIDMAAVPDLERCAAKALADCERLVVDMSGLTFIDSSGIRFLVNLHRQAEREGWALQMIPAVPSVQRIFDTVGLSDHLPFIVDRSGPPAE